MKLKNNFINNIINLNKLLVILISALFIMSGVTVLLPKINSVNITSIIWDVTMDFTSPDGSGDSVFFGEAPDANDGSPADIYDVPHPPAPPEPYIYAWLNDRLSNPYNQLRKDYRLYPDTEKTWNLTVKWIGSSSTTVTITWNNIKLADSEYDSILLYKDESQIKDMSTQNSYSYSAQPGISHHFTIITQGGSQNNPPNNPDNPDPIDGETNVDVNTDLSWTGGDPDGDPVTYDVYFGITSPPTKVSSNQSSTSYDLGTMNYDETYYWKIIAWDDKDASSESPEWNFQTTVYTTIIQKNEKPSQDATDIDNEQSFVSVEIADIDGNTMTWTIEVSNGDNNSSSTPGNRTINCNLSTPLTYDSNIIWYVNVTNGNDWNNKSYSFKVESNPSGNNGGGGAIPPDTPIANAGGPYNSHIGGEIKFDGSESTGSINSYIWKLGDGNTTYGITPTYTYTKTGRYIVNLTVTGPDGNDSDVTYATITEYPNNPPTKPVINGPTKGHKNTNYEYTTISTDLDNDSIQYIFDWNDGEKTTTEFLSNGTATNQIHSWKSAGEYIISVKAYDNITESASTQHTVLIDVWPIDDIIKGFLLDDDSDDIYDLFHNDTSGKETNVEQDNDKNYLIDSDNDGDWDYKYDIEKGLTPIHKEKEKTPGFEIIVLLTSIVIVVVFIRRKH